MNTTTGPLSIDGTLRFYLQPWAYDLFGLSVYVDQCNVAFIAAKLIKHGNPDATVYPRATRNTQPAASNAVIRP